MNLASKDFGAETQLSINDFMDVFYDCIMEILAEYSILNSNKACVKNAWNKNVRYLIRIIGITAIIMIKKDLKNIFSCFSLPPLITASTTVACAQLRRLRKSNANHNCNLFRSDNCYDSRGGVQLKNIGPAATSEHGENK